MRPRSLPVLPLLLVLTASSCGYNTIQTMDERANKAKQQIEVQLQRRADLIPNLVNTVKGYAAHEEAVFTNVTQARAGLVGAVQKGDPQEMAMQLGPSRESSPAECEVASTPWVHAVGSAWPSVAAERVDAKARLTSLTRTLEADVIPRLVGQHARAEPAAWREVGRKQKTEPAAARWSAPRGGR